MNSLIYVFFTFMVIGFMLALFVGAFNGYHEKKRFPDFSKDHLKENKNDKSTLDEI